MPDPETIKRAQEDLREHRSPSTAAGEFVREEMHHIREGKHGATSTKQAIAIGLSKARRAGVPLQPPGDDAGAKTRQSAARDSAVGQGRRRPKSPSGARSRATSKVLKRKPHRAASHAALSAQARQTARRRGPKARKASAKKAAATRRRQD